MQKKLQDIVGNERVLDSPGVLEQYSNDHSFVPSITPVLVVKPKNQDKISHLEAVLREPWA